MKTLTNTFAAIVILIIVVQLSFPLRVASANEPASEGEQSYKLNVTNLNYTSPNSLEFDIYLLNTNTGKSEFNYFLGQYFLEFNPNITNGGNLTYSVVSSGLPESVRPRNPSVIENCLSLACNSIGLGTDNLVIPKEAPGILIVKMRLETSACTFSEEPLNLKWTGESSKLRTKIFSKSENKNAEITNHGNHTLDFLSGDGLTQNNPGLPKDYALSQNYPNPFNPGTNIHYELPKSGHVTMKVYDMLGKQVATLVNEGLNAGVYNVNFNGSNFSSGVYFYRIEAGDFMQIRRMVLVK